MLLSDFDIVIIRDALLFYEQAIIDTINNFDDLERSGVFDEHSCDRDKS